MLINNSETSIEDIYNVIDIDKTLLKNRGNGILLSDEQTDILNRYDINYQNCSSINELIYIIEDVLNDSYQDADDLEYLSSQIAEYNYYNNTNK